MIRGKLKEAIMQRRNQFNLLIVLLGIFPFLFSCATKQVTYEPLPAYTKTPSPVSTTSRMIVPTANRLLNVIPSPTENIVPILYGRILFAGIGISENSKIFGIKMLEIKSNKTTQIIEKNLNVDGQSIILNYPMMAWAPDGHWFAFIGTDSEMGYEDVYISKADGSEFYRLTHTPQYNKYSISWSPNGQYIILAMGLKNTSDLYLVNSKNGEIEKRLTSSGSTYKGVWSPDGKSIAFEIYSGFAIMDVASKAEKIVRLSLGKLRMSDMSWSPQGDQIAFSAYPYYPVDERCKGDIFLANINTGGMINLTGSIYDETSPSWSPDGKYIVFSRSTYECGNGDQNAEWNIFLTNILREEQKLISNAGYRTIVSWDTAPSLEIGKKYIVTGLGANLNLRTEPSLDGKTVEKLQAGEVLTILEGFVDADNYYWWKVQTQNGDEGWVAENSSWYKLMTE
jgi:Tol biopolymer transport system component